MTNCIWTNVSHDSDEYYSCDSYNYCDCTDCLMTFLGDRLWCGTGTTRCNATCSCNQYCSNATNTSHHFTVYRSGVSCGIDHAHSIPDTAKCTSGCVLSDDVDAVPVFGCMNRCCAKGTFGPNCDSECECNHGECITSKEDSVQKCTCHPGWQNSIWAPCNVPTPSFNTRSPSTQSPTKDPSHKPTQSPTTAPLHQPTQSPSHQQTKAPTKSPSHRPTQSPTTKGPTLRPTSACGFVCKNGYCNEGTQACVCYSGYSGADCSSWDTFKLIMTVASIGSAIVSIVVGAYKAYENRKKVGVFFRRFCPCCFNEPSQLGGDDVPGDDVPGEPGYQRLLAIN